MLIGTMTSVAKEEWVYDPQNMCWKHSWIIHGGVKMQMPIQKSIYRLLNVHELQALWIKWNVKFSVSEHSWILLTVFSWVSDHHFRFRPSTVIIQGLNFNFIGNVGRSSLNKKLRNIGYVLWWPLLLRVLLSPLHFVLQTGPVGLESRQRLHTQWLWSVCNTNTSYPPELKVNLTVQEMTRLPGCSPTPWTFDGFTSGAVKKKTKKTKHNNLDQ